MRALGSLSIVLLVLLLPAAAECQTGYIGLYADWPEFNYCSILDADQGFVDVYVVHKNTAGAAGCRFIGEMGAGFGCLPVGEIHPHSTEGSFLSGADVFYGMCLSTEIVVMQLQFSCTGRSSTCGRLKIMPHPDSVTGQVEVVDCNRTTFPASGGTLTVNSDGSCPCGVLPVSSQTWGTIKSLYD